MTSLSLSKCLFCFKSVSSSADRDGRERISKFLKGFQRHVHTNLPSVGDSLSLTHSSMDCLQVKVCSSCSEVVDSFNELYDEFKTLELRLDWVLDTVANTIKFANQVPARFAHFRLDLQTSLEETHSDTPPASILTQITAFRQKIQRKGHCNPHQFPRVVLKKRAPPPKRRPSPHISKREILIKQCSPSPPILIKQEPQIPPDYSNIEEFFPECQLEIGEDTIPFEGHDPGSQLEEGEIPEKRKVLFMCHLCNKTFPSQLSCQIHLKTHNASDTPRMPPKIRTKAPRVLPSNYTVHPNAKKVSNLVSSQQNSATSAGSQFMKFRSKTKHRRTRAPNKYFCGTCGKGCKDEHNLHYHKLTHANPATWKFGCPVCGKRFIVKQNLKVHMRVHSKVRPFVCQVCGVGYNHAVSLRQHSEKYHGGTSMIRTFDPAIDAI